MRSERRKYIRFRAQDTAYAALGAEFTQVGRLIDISIGGLSSSIPEDSLPSEISVAPISPGRSAFNRGSKSSQNAKMSFFAPLRLCVTLFFR